jgi:formylglycine-generating enzyme required for sulfatase activity
MRLRLPVLCVSLVFLAVPVLAQQSKNVTVRPLPGAPAPTGRGWGLIVGINDYKDQTINPLHFAAADAQRVCDLLTDPQRGGFERSKVKLLLNREATREAILIALKALEGSATPEDTVFIYFSGHGLEDGGMSYFIPADGNPQLLTDTGISLDRFNESLSRCPAGRKVVMLDACHSGVIEGRKGSGLMTQDFRRRAFQEAKGRIVLSSCGPGEASYEWKEQGRSVFTYYLGEALEGAADKDGDGFVTADEAAKYTCEKVEEWAFQHGLKQTPQREYYALTGDIVLACRPGRNESEIASYLGRSGPAFTPGLTPSKLGWGADDKAYPDKFVVNPRDGAEMLWVPAGTFAMGSEDPESEEKPVHQVTLDGFWLYRTEVTNGQFAEFVQSSGCVIEGSWQNDTARGENHPVVCVTWNDAKAYADWAGVALPTEGQWEYGARGPEGRTYPWGNDWDAQKCCNDENKGGGSPPTTFPVGTFPQGASWCGALDMEGNVSEWCADWYGPYEAGSQRNPQGSSTGSMRVLRGGGWGDNGLGCRAAVRSSLAPVVRDGYLGFRGGCSSK